MFNKDSATLLIAFVTSGSKLLLLHDGPLVLNGIVTLFFFFF